MEECNAAFTEGKAYCMCVMNYNKYLTIFDT